MEREDVCRGTETNLQRCWWRWHNWTLQLKPEWCFGACRIKQVGKNIYFIFYWCFWALSTFKSRYSRVIYRKPLSIKKMFLLAKVTEKMTLKMIRALSWLLKSQTTQGLLTKLFETTNICLKFSHFCCAKERERLHYAFFTFYLLLLVSWNTNWKLCDILQTYFPLNYI